MQDLNAVSKTEAVGALTCLRRRLTHPGTHSIMGEQQTIDFLIDEQGILAAQGCLCEAQGRFGFPNDLFISQRS